MGLALLCGTAVAMACGGKVDDQPGGNGGTAGAGATGGGGTGATTTAGGGAEGGTTAGGGGAGGTVTTGGGGAGGSAPWESCFGADGKYVQSALDVCTQTTVCAMVEHEIDCCGTIMLVGIDSALEAEFDACEAAWRDHLGVCNCPAGKPQIQQPYGMEAASTGPATTASASPCRRASERTCRRTQAGHSPQGLGCGCGAASAPRRSARRRRPPCGRPWRGTS
jgi:hypothetical protein